jgi:hypothetical protein
MTRDDHGLIDELKAFMDKENIYPLKYVSFGGGCMNALFTIQDGEKVAEFLAKSGGIDITTAEASS